MAGIWTLQDLCRSQRNFLVGWGWNTVDCDSRLWMVAAKYSQPALVKPGENECALNNPLNVPAERRGNDSRLWKAALTAAEIEDFRWMIYATPGPHATFSVAPRWRSSRNRGLEDAEDGDAVRTSGWSAAAARRRHYCLGMVALPKAANTTIAPSDYGW